MELNQESIIVPINTSSCFFGVMYENNFVVLDDAKHVIGVDPFGGKFLILENIENGKSDKFEFIDFYLNNFSTLFYDDKTGFLFSGDTEGQLNQYKVDTASKSCKKKKEYGNLCIGEIFSSHRFLHFVFFGGSWGKIRVLDLSTGELLPGHLQTSMEWIYSLQVCVKNQDQIYLALSGFISKNSEDKTELFDITGLLPKDPIILQKLFLEYSIDCEGTILPHLSTDKSQEETMQKLTKERNS